MQEGYAGLLNFGGKGYGRTNSQGGEHTWLTSRFSPVRLALCEDREAWGLRRADSQLESQVERVDPELDCLPKGLPVPFLVTLTNITLDIERRTYLRRLWNGKPGT
jgi:hypothetical protein